MLNLPKQLEHVFRKAGWDGSVRRTPNSAVPTDHPAYPVIQYFDGLHVKHAMVDELGQQAREADIEFQWLPTLWPAASKWSSRLNSIFVGIGLTRRSYSQIWIADDGRYFASNDITEQFEFIADNWHDAISSILNALPTQELLDHVVPAHSDDDRFYNWKSNTD